MASSKGGKERLPKLLRVDSLYKNMCVIIFLVRYTKLLCARLQLKCDVSSRPNDDISRI